LPAAPINHLFHTAWRESLQVIIQPTSIAAQLWAGAAATSVSESLRLGSVQTAQLVGVSLEGLLILQIGATTVEADPTAVPLPPQFQVRVLTTGPLPQLEVMADIPDDRVMMQALRDRLPQQAGYAPLLGTLDALARRPATRALPVELRAALANLEAAVPTPDDLADPDTLKQAVVRSGLFLEARLVDEVRQQQQPGLPLPPAPLPEEGDDWKAALLKLASALTRQPMPAGRVPPQQPQETPPPLRQRPLPMQPRMLVDADTDVDTLVEHLRANTRGAVARLEISQLESQPQTNVWMLELPIRGDHGYDILQLRIEREASQMGEGGVDSWTLGFAIDLPSLGPLQGDIHLRGMRTSVRLWGQFEPSVKALEAQAPSLRRMIEQAGLQLEHLSIVQGLPQVKSERSAVFLETTA
jgi:hypothetical protein